MLISFYTKFIWHYITMKTASRKAFIQKTLVATLVWFIIWFLTYFLFCRITKVDTKFSSFIFTNPALNYTEIKEWIMTNKALNLSKQINDYSTYKKALWDITHLSVYFRNLNNWGWFWVNEKEYFSPASLMKLPILISYIKKSESEPWLLNQKLIYKKNSHLPIYKQNIPPENQLLEWEEYSLREVLQYMIIYSDNHASSLLEELLPIEDLQKTFTDIWLIFPEMKNGSFDNNVRVTDYASFFRILFNSSYLNRENSEKVLNILSKIDFKAWLAAWVPENIKVSHKFGERGIIWSNWNEEKQLHDCGIVYYPNHPYLLCIMTRWYDWNKLKAIISDISQIFYTETKNQYWENPMDIEV